MIRSALSAPYAEIRKLRSTGACDAALARLSRTAPACEADAFEAAVCLFVCGNLEDAAHVCASQPWKSEWAVHAAGAMVESLRGGDSERAIALAARAASCPDVPYDAVAMYLLLLHSSGRDAEGAAYVASRLENPPAGETFLLTVVAELAAATRNWRDAYRCACAVLAEDPEDYRALIVLSAASYELGNVHEALGCAIRAHAMRAGSPPAVLQVMRCWNRLGNAYAALGAYEALGREAVSDPEIALQLGQAHEGIGDAERAAAEYRHALLSESVATAALRRLVALLAAKNATAELEALQQAHGERIDADFVCSYGLALAALNSGRLEESARLLERTRVLSRIENEPRRQLPWSDPGARLRHDRDQLELLARRGHLDARGRDALALLERYGNADPATLRAAAPDEAEKLANVLQETYYIPRPAFSAPALAQRNYAEIEEQYLASRIVVIDDFLQPEALESLRRFCEEATVWKSNYERGYVGAELAAGFSPPVLLVLSQELRRAMPRVIGERPLTQAWAFKYDQRHEGINMHADFAEVNINFWITPDEACVDPTRGGLVIYDVPVPGHWTFQQYNSDAATLAAYVKAHGARPQRVPYRANRCALFDSSLIHVTDELHFKPGYENRRVNVTLLYGTPRNVS